MVAKCQRTVVHIYNHTHWDREWYEPFEVYRAYLIEVVRQMLCELEAGRLGNFLLDGQAVVLEDIQELAPDLMVPLRKQMQAGCVQAGPWYVLPDQMLVSGESLIRNLYLGRNLVEQYAPCLRVGYAPDTFGHSQDLPRILQGFGINNAFVWRGVPRLPEGPLFCWQSPDHSCVTAHLFTRGYYQTDLYSACRLYKSAPEEAISSIIAFFENFLAGRETECAPLPVLKKTLREEAGAIFPAGADHIGVCENQKGFIEAVNKVLEETNANFYLRSSSLGEIAQFLVERQKGEELPLVRGELRDNSQSAEHTYAYLLPGVLSTRLYLKAANIDCEWKLFRLFEPLFSVFSMLGLSTYPQVIVERACKLLLKNHPHDSICGCSIDAVHREMMVRYDKVRQLLAVALSGIENKLAAEHTLHFLDPDNNLSVLCLFNSSLRAFSGVVPVTFFLPENSGIDKTARNSAANLQVDKVMVRDQLFSGWGAVPYYKNVESVSGWMYLPAIPALGVTPVEPQTAGIGDTVSVKPVCCRDLRLDNGLLAVFVNDTGALVVRNLKTGQERMLGHRFLDVGDGGDTYNFDPLPDDPVVTSRLVQVERGLGGPLCASLALTYEILLPAGIVGGDCKIDEVTAYLRDSNKIAHHIRCEVFLKADSRIVEFETAWINQSREHRLSVEFNTGFEITHSFSENHFSTVKRAHAGFMQSCLPVPGRREAPLDRFPSQRFLYANGLLVLHEGLPEYGVQGNALELTVLRSVAILSRGRMLSRGGGAGPHLEVPEAAQLGFNRVRYGLAVLDWSSTNSAEFSEEKKILAYSLVEKFLGTVHTMMLPRGHAGTLHKDLIAVDNEAICLSALYYSSRQNCFVLRLLNVAASPQSCTLAFNVPVLALDAANLNEEKLAADFVCSKPEEGHPKTLVEVDFSANQLRTFLLYM